VVVGVVERLGGGRLAFAVVDLANPMGLRSSAGRNWRPGLRPGGRVLKGDAAYVGLQGGSGGRTLVVSLATLTSPRVARSKASAAGCRSRQRHPLRVRLLHLRREQPPGRRQDGGAAPRRNHPPDHAIRVTYRDGQPVTDRVMVIEGDIVPAGYELRSVEVEIYGTVSCWKHSPTINRATSPRSGRPGSPSP